jgi:hypothetical protein
MRSFCAILCLATVFAAVPPTHAQFIPINPPAGLNPAGGGQDSITWSQFQSGQQSRIRQQGSYLLTTQNEYQNFWTRLTGQPADTAPPGVNWFNERLLVVTLGTRSTGGYSVFVQSVRNLPNGRTAVRAIERTPMPGQYVSEGQTAPYAIVKVPHTVNNVSLSVLPAQAMPGVILAPGAYYGTPGGQAGVGFGPETGPNAVSFEAYSSGPYSLVNRQSLFVLNDERDLARHWEQALGRPADSIPGGIDWNRQKLVAVHLGQRRTGGYGIIVAGMRRTENGTVAVRAVERRPVPGSFVTQVITSPFVILKVVRRADNFKLSVVPQEPTGAIID